MNALIDWIVPSHALRFQWLTWGFSDDEVWYVPELDDFAGQHLGTRFVSTVQGNRLRYIRSNDAYTVTLGDESAHRPPSGTPH